MAKLTELQKQTFQAIHDDTYLSYREYARDTGTDVSTVRKRYRRACYLLGEIPKEREIRDFDMDAEIDAKFKEMDRQLGEPERDRRARVDAAKGKYGHKDMIANPELEAEAIYRLSDPQLSSIADAARSTNMKPETLRRLLRKLEEGMTPVNRVIKDVRMDYISQVAGDRAMMVVESIDEVDVKTASLKDKTIAFGILTEKKLLIDGMPTQRLEISDRRHLDELVMEAMLEAQRRGMDVAVSEGKAVVTRDRMLVGGKKLDYKETKEAMDAELID